MRLRGRPEMLEAERTGGGGGRGGPGLCPVTHRRKGRGFEGAVLRGPGSHRSIGCVPHLGSWCPNRRLRRTLSAPRRCCQGSSSLSLSHSQASSSPLSLTVKLLPPSPSLCLSSFFAHACLCSWPALTFYASAHACRILGRNRQSGRDAGRERWVVGGWAPV